MAANNVIVPWGKPKSSVLVVGFCPHSTDLRQGFSFTGGAGRNLAYLMSQEGFTWNQVRKHCIIPRVAPLDNPERWFVPAKEVPPDWKPFLKVKGKFLNPDLFPDIVNFQKFLEEERPNLVIAIGAMATSILTGEQKFDQVRGTILPCSLVDGVKVLPIYDPATIFKMKKWEPILCADLRKAFKESQIEGIVRIRREIFVPELVHEIHDWWRANASEGQEVSVDIETVPAYKLITCIGFAVSKTKSIVIPFYKKGAEGGAYWSPSEHLIALQFCRSILHYGNYRIVGQNYIYDAQWVYEQMRIRSINYCEDTMLKHHSLYPEMQKSLGFLASIYTTEPSWKGMVNFNEDKKDG